MTHTRFLFLSILLFSLGLSSAIAETMIGPLQTDYREHVFKTPGGAYDSSGLVSTDYNLTLGNYSGSRFRIFYQWSIPDNLVPDGATITRAKLELSYSVLIAPEPYLNMFFSRVDYDITSTPVKTLFDALEDPNTPHFQGDQANNGRYEQEFQSGYGIADWLTSQLPNNRLTIGVSVPTELQHEYSYTLNSLSVKLTIWVAPQTVTADQAFEDGSRITNSTIGHYQDAAFATYGVPHPFAFDLNSIQTMHADTSLWPNPHSGLSEKYKTWNDLSDVVNHKDFLIRPPLQTVISQFKPAKSATIQAQLIDGGAVGGSIDFKDPWLIDDRDAKGPKNRGSNAIWHNQSSPFTVSTSDNWYKGLFLNQPVVSGQAYYSVGATSPTTFNDITGYFRYWAGNNVQYQSAGSAQTGVVFTSSGATPTAMYKGHLVSSISGAISGNSQRKLVSNDGSYFQLGYESAGDVWITASPDAGATWYPEQLMSDGTAKSSAPSLAMHGIPILNPPPVHSDLHVVYRTLQNQSGPYDLFVRTRTPFAWGPATKINGASSVAFAVNPHPVIARHSATRGKGDDTPELLAVWEGGLTSSDHLKYSTTGYVNGNWEPWAAVANVPNTDNSHRNPSLTSAIDDRYGHPLYLTYDNGDNILMQTFGVNPAVWSGLQTVPASVSPTSFASQVTADTRGLNPMVYVVWEAVGGEQLPPPPGTDRGSTWAGNGATNLHRVMYQKRVGNAWDPAYEFRSNTIDYFRPTVSNLDNGHVAWAWDDGSNTYQTLYNGSAWSVPTVTSGTMQPNLAMAGSQYPLPATRSVSTSTAGPVYRLNVSGQISRPLSGPQASIVSQQYSRRVVVARAHSLRPPQAIEGNGPIISDSSSSVSLELAPLTLKLTDGSMVQVEFAAAGDSVVDERSAWNSLASTPVMLTSSIDSILVSGGVDAHAPLILAGSEIGMAFDVVDADRGTVLQRVGLERVFNTDSSTSFVCRGRVASLAGKRVFLRPRVRGFEKRERNLVSTLVHVYTLIDDSTSKPTAPLAKATTSSLPLPTAYALHQNYPNPFNPTTEIRFDLPDAGNVSLVVYDVLGRKVAELANGYQAAGYHTATWNATGAASGVYFARFSVTSAGGAVAYTKVNKLMLIR